MSALLSPINFADTLEFGGLCPSNSFIRQVYFMNKFRDNIEILFLITIFITSLSAITPIS